MYKKRAGIVVVVLGLVLSGLSILPDNAGSVEIGLVIDLDEGTPYKHPDAHVNFSLRSDMEVWKYLLTDLNDDGVKDIAFVIRVWHDIEYTNSIWLCPGPICTNGSMDDKVERIDLPEKDAGCDLVYYGDDDRPDLLTYQKNGRSNDTISLYEWSAWNSPWSVPRFTLEMSNDTNGTVLFVQTMDVNRDGYRDLIVFKELSYKDAKNNTHSKMDVLISDGRKDLRGDLDESAFDTSIDSVWGRFDMYYPWLSFYDGASISILVNNPQYKPAGYIDPIGRVYTLDSIDLSKSNFSIEGNMTREIVDLRKIGNPPPRANPIRHNGRDDLRFYGMLMDCDDFKGRIVSPTKDDMRIDAGTDKLLFTDFNGDGREDLICDYLDSWRNYVTVGLHADQYTGTLSMEDVQDIVIRDSNLSRFIPNFFVDEANGDGKKDLLVMVGDSQTIWGNFSIFTILGRSFGPPVIEHVRSLEYNVQRGGVLKVEVTSTDPQCFPKYLGYELEVRMGASPWFVPTVQKIVDNWTSEKPYEGTRIIWIEVPKGNITGTIDLKVRASNTFGLRSALIERDNIACIHNERPQLYKVDLYPPSMTRKESLDIHGFILDKDDEGPFSFKVDLISDRARTTLLKDDNMSKGEFDIACRLPQQIEANRTYSVNVSVTDPIGDNASLEDFTVFLIPEKPAFEILHSDIGVYRGKNLTLVYDLDRDTAETVLRVWSYGSFDLNLSLEEGAGIKVNIAVPLDSELGSRIVAYSLYDGYWYSNGSFDTVIMNNPPHIDLPEVIVINGGYEINLTEIAGDDEDGVDLLVHFTTNSTGLEIDYDRTTHILSLGSGGKGFWTVNVNVEDKDGDIASDSMKVALFKNPTRNLEITVIGLDGVPISGAKVYYDYDDCFPEFWNGTTGSDGKVKFEGILIAPLKVWIYPPDEMKYINESRSGYLDKVIFVDATSTSVTVELAWKEAFADSIVLVKVMDQIGSPVAGATVELKGSGVYTNMTDLSGEVTFEGILPGSYEITVFYGDTTLLRKTVAISSGENNLTLTVELQEEIEGNDDGPSIYPWLVFTTIVAIGLTVLIFLMRKKKTNRVEE